MFEIIRSNHIKSAVMVSLMGALLAALGAFFGYYFFNDPLIGVILAVIIWAIMWLVTYYQGDSILLSTANARKIEKKDAPRLFDVVEEMTIAAGLPKMPDVYIIEDPALNAFATGRDINHASVAITSGLLEKLNRDELQGVIGHEIAHIKDRDVLLMVILSVMVGTIVILSWYASRMMFFGGMSGGGNRKRRGDNGGGLQIILVVIGLILAILAPIFAQLIYFAVSRRREYLSDASSALFTRYPEGLASALEKLTTNSTHVVSANKATSAMYIADPFQKAALKADEITSTHPPIADRIRVLRRMSGASYADYEKAYEETHKGERAIPQAAVAEVPGGSGSSSAVPGSVGLRGPSTDNSPVSNAGRARETSNLLYKLDDYKVIDCDCGVRLKVPADYPADQVKCPRCGETHDISEAH